MAVQEQKKESIWSKIKHELLMITASLKVAFRKGWEMSEAQRKRREERGRNDQSL